MSDRRKIREGLSEEVTFERTPGGSGDRTHEDSEGRGCPRAGKWKCQGLEVGEGRVCEDPQGGGCWAQGLSVEGGEWGSEPGAVDRLLDLV